MNQQVFSPSKTSGGSGANAKMRAHLRCFFCFQPHRHHYIVFCYNVELKLWMCFDDDKVTPVSRMGLIYIYLFEMLSREESTT